MKVESLSTVVQLDERQTSASPCLRLPSVSSSSRLTIILIDSVSFFSSNISQHVRSHLLFFFLVVVPLRVDADEQDDSLEQ